MELFIIRIEDDSGKTRITACQSREKAVAIGVSAWNPHSTVYLTPTKANASLGRESLLFDDRTCKLTKFEQQVHAGSALMDYHTSRAERNMSSDTRDALQSRSGLDNVWRTKLASDPNKDMDIWPGDIPTDRPTRLQKQPDLVDREALVTHYSKGGKPRRFGDSGAVEAGEIEAPGGNFFFAPI